MPKDDERKLRGCSFEVMRHKMSRVLFRRVPILSLMPKYTRQDAACDFVAGITVGLTLMPQAIAYAGLAGLAAQHGLYSAFAGSLLYVIFGTIRQVSIGPTSLMAILAGSYTRGLPPDFIILLALLAGCVELLMGLLDLGFLVDFISAPVVSGFTSATSVIIISTQLRGLFGFTKRAHGFFPCIKHAVLSLYNGDFGTGDTILGLTCIVALLSLRRLSNVTCIKSAGGRKAFWFVSIGRNALIVLTCSVIAWFYETRGGGAPFKLSGHVPQRLPKFSFPNTTTQVGNQTYSFWEMCETFGSGILFVPLVAVLANVAIAKAFSAGRMVDASQEMVTLGICNIAGSMVQAMPTCGAFTRSAVSEASGIRTPLAGAYSGTLILLALTYLTPYFRFIPSACLSAVLISAVMFMVDYKVLKRTWRCGTKFDLGLVILTFCVSLWKGVEMGLMAGTCADAFRLAAPWCRPRVTIERKVASIINLNTSKREMNRQVSSIIIRPELGLLYPGVDRVRHTVVKEASRNPEASILVDCSSLIRIDFTAMRGLIDLLIELTQVRLVNVSDGLRKRLMAAAGSARVAKVTGRLGDKELEDLNEKKPLLATPEQYIIEDIPAMDEEIENNRKPSLTPSFYDNIDDCTTYHKNNGR